MTDGPICRYRWHMGETRCALPEGHGPLPNGTEHMNHQAVEAEQLRARARAAEERAERAEAERDEALAETGPSLVVQWIDAWLLGDEPDAHTARWAVQRIRDQLVTAGARADGPVAKQYQAAVAAARAEGAELRDKWLRTHGESSHIHRLLDGPDGVLDAVRAVLRVPPGQSVIIHAERAHAEGERLRRALREVAAYLGENEWDAWRSSDGGREDFVGAACCPDCAGMKTDGHGDPCRLAAALAAARAALGDAPPEEKKP